jgi:translation initiation factor IF-3
MRGRESSHMNLWIEKMNLMVQAMSDVAESAGSPQPEGRTLTVTIEPIGSKNNH